jgi:hypothetical protein
VLVLVVDGGVEHLLDGGVPTTRGQIGDVADEMVSLIPSIVIAAGVSLLVGTRGRPDRTPPPAIWWMRRDLNAEEESDGRNRPNR